MCPVKFRVNNSIQHQESLRTGIFKLVQPWFLCGWIILIALIPGQSVLAAIGDITTVAGGGVGDSGTATAASLYIPDGITVDSTGNLFITDRFNNRIRRVDAATGIITTVAGNGTSGFSGDGAATAASLNLPVGVKVDSAGNLFIADQGNSRIRRVDAATGVITTFAGNGTGGFSGDGGAATAAMLANPWGVTVDRFGNLFIADTGNGRIRRVDIATAVITTVAGGIGYGFGGDGGAATAATLSSPTGITVDSAGNLFLTGPNNDRVRRVDATTKVITTVAGGGSPLGDGGTATAATLYYPFGVAVDSVGNLIITDPPNARIRRVDMATGFITTMAASASISSPLGVTVGGAGNLFVVDQVNNRIRRIDVSTGVITTVAGNGLWGFSGDSGSAMLAGVSPFDLAADNAGNLFIADHCCPINLQ